MSAQPPALIPHAELTERSESAPVVPALIAAAGDPAVRRFLDFFAVAIRNSNTRRAYGRACGDFLGWCAETGVQEVTAVLPLHVATWIGMQTSTLAAPSVKQHLAAVRRLFDWLMTGQVVAVNPAASVRGPAHVVHQGKTPVLEAAEARALLDSIDSTTHSGLRDRALIGLMIYSFARIGAALGMRSRTCSPRTAASGCGCRRKAASRTPFHAITACRNTLLLTWSRPGSWRTITGRCSAPSGAAPAV